MRQVGYGIVNRRLQRLTRLGDPPFRSAGLGTGDVFKAARTTSLVIDAGEGEWQRGLATAEREYRRALAFGDGWVPHATRPEYGGDDVLAKLPDFRDMAKAAGRDPATIPITTFNTAGDPDTLKRFRDAGVSRVVFSVPSEEAPKTLAQLDKLAAAMRAAE